MSETVVIQTEHGDPELRASLAGLTTIEEFCAIADVSEMQTSVTDSRLESQYTGAVAVTHLGLRVGHCDIDIISYGSRQHIFDYKGILGPLLQQDIDELKAAISGTPLHPFVSTLRISEALEKCLLSKLNDDILASSTAGPAKSGHPADPKSSRLVSNEYFVEASTTLRKAVNRVYGQGVWLTAALSFCLSIFVLFCARIFWWDRMAAWEWGFITGSIGAVVGIAAQWSAQRRLLARFDVVVGRRLEEAIRTGHSSSTWRVSIVLLAFVGVALMMWTLN